MALALYFILRRKRRDDEGREREIAELTSKAKALRREIDGGKVPDKGAAFGPTSESEDAEWLNFLTHCQVAICVLSIAHGRSASASDAYAKGEQR